MKNSYYPSHATEKKRDKGPEWDEAQGGGKESDGLSQQEDFTNPH